jgi:hypothetical protein
MIFRRRRKKLQRQSLRARNCSARLGLETLERRDLLAITWVNEGNASLALTDPNYDKDAFVAFYGLGNAPLARQIVERAIADWNKVITNFNYNDPNNPTNEFDLTVDAAAMSGSGERGNTDITAITSNAVPTKATTVLDDDGGGVGWYFDPTPNDDAEFTAIVNSGANGSGTAFQASFIGTGAADFYRTITHEIGHAIGLLQNTEALVGTKIVNYLTAAGTDAHSGAGLYAFHNPSGSYGVNATFTTTGAFHLCEDTSPNDLMNPGRSLVYSGVTTNSTTRQFISDLDAEILADAYGYTIKLPSQINTAYASLDSLTGTLLVQGGVSAQNPSGTNDNFAINIQTGTPYMLVQVNNTKEYFYTADITQLVIAQNGGTDTVQIGAGLPMPTYINYVVSSNQDTAATGTYSGVTIVDSSSVIPGRQTSLRAANSTARGLLLVRATHFLRMLAMPRLSYQTPVFYRAVLPPFSTS